MTQRIFITGASSGIGAELARQYAAPDVLLGLTARRADRLAELAQECQAAGAQVAVYAVDVTDQPAMIETAQAFIERAGGAVDLVIANAGTGGPDALKSGDPAPLTEVMSINVNGMINTLLPFVPSMRQRGSGHLVAIASVAGYRALPWRATYSASKIAMRTLMEGWGWCLDRYKIDTTCINPGFIVSELTDKNEFDMPFILQTDDACRRIRRAIAKRKRVYTFPLPMAILSRLLTVIPGWLLQRLPLG